MTPFILLCGDHCLQLRTGQPIQPFCEDSYAAGDRVIVELDPDAWKSLQEGHGGWNDLMSMVPM